ncbi:MAG: bifunctional methylenetetrahydrofolate dehydrogenase/methenyltetrahydrofolate cyclohydrolase FolD [Agathobaculum sp.]|uniref:bifunctional methylenetetrahydrofolate dehydrogenase/methenyltetrahydrofolate cyclohydrolase FolD n=1 Tax=Agathobaculum sp. TaxID=2048138 RepID=UPI0025BAE4C4|nr:bifunctional methylenetetrahydrofolate dehydrogenase/methenyltetrahydrofolate cyclohydrolase FolD [Agathobaculum sp.]MCI7124879.1 bifunctional methylenetetrahydrofolate dehydrogenase/methenyltetrahydrofolate cyclohydrolase FolD [Agathobaculum sp.]MDY3711468.1 bifunctional methylenetetrahydrofolate dehydrogenase/methenyltetrahydrofolate cyclohydrolase FolD [Agathobaculum sp.]
MSAVKMDGKALSDKVRGSILAETEALKQRGITPGLAVIIVGNDPASEIYVRNKEKACAACGFYSEKYALPAETTQDELLGLIAQLNESPRISGILCQMPVPAHISAQAVIDAIDPRKDVDAFHPVNVGKIMVGDFDFVPCTPAGVMELLAAYQIDPAGKECVVIGRSNIVGKPMAMLLLHKHGTVTLCHSRTQGLDEVCRRADILIAAVGKAGFVTPDMVKDGAVVIDVGINRNAAGKVCGDVDPAVMEKASYMTPVPGGAGPMTITMLMKNTLKAAKLQNGL